MSGISSLGKETVRLTYRLREPVGGKEQNAGNPLGLTNPE